MADEISLEFIGRSLLAVHDELRGVRSEMNGLRSEVNAFRDEVHGLRREFHLFGIDLREVKAEVHEIRTVLIQTVHRVDALEAARP